MKCFALIVLVPAVRNSSISAERFAYHLPELGNSFADQKLHDLANATIILDRIMLKS